MTVQSPLLLYDPVAHRYTLGGTPVPSVTQILLSAGIIDTIHFTPSARDRGRDVHLLTQYDDQGIVDDDGTPEDLLGYLQAWRAFKKTTGFCPSFIEYQVHHPLLRYAGTVDRLGAIQNAQGVLEIKTENVPAWTGIQLAGYAQCLSEKLLRWSVALKGDGTFRFREHTDPQEAAVFRAALLITQWKERNHG